VTDQSSNAQRKFLLGDKPICRRELKSVRAAKISKGGEKHVMGVVSLAKNLVQIAKVCLM